MMEVNETCFSQTCAVKNISRINPAESGINGYLYCLCRSTLPSRFRSAADLSIKFSRLPGTIYYLIPRRPIQNRATSNGKLCSF